MNIRVLFSSSKGNSTLIDDGRTKLLLDCGGNFARIQQELNYQVSEVTAVLVSHEHKDHCACVPEFLRRGTSVYLTKGTAERLNVSFDPAIRIVKPYKDYIIGTWKIMPFPTRHDAQEPVGFLCVSKEGKVLYVTDTSIIPFHFPGVEYLIVECNHILEIVKERNKQDAMNAIHFNRVVNNHLSLETLLAFLESHETKLKGVWLLHISDGNSDELEITSKIEQAANCEVYLSEG